MTKRISNWKIAAALLVMSIIPGQAFAQYNPEGNRAQMNSERNFASRSIDSTVQILPDRDTPQQFNTYSEMMIYGGCAARVAAGKLRGAMVEKAGSAAERRMWKEAVVLSQSCKGSNFRPIFSLQRGVYAEGMYHASMTGGVAYGPLQSSDPGYAMFLAREKEHNFDLDVNDQIMANATNCMVALQPGVADAVLGTRHGSAEEATAMDALFASAPSCAGAKRQTRLSRSFLRAYVASSAYRYAMFRTPALASATK